IAGVIHVPGWPSLGIEAQALMTRSKSVSAWTVQSDRRNVRRIRVDRRTPSVRNTVRGSGDHHSSGWPSEYQGNTPCAYALSSRVDVRSPPIASSPSGSRSAVRGSGNGPSGSAGSSGRRIGIAARPGGWGGLERRTRREGLRVAANRLGLVRAPRAQGLPEGGVRDPVAAADGARQEPPRQLVLALRAGLESRRPLAQAVLDALVVAGL